MAIEIKALIPEMAEAYLEFFDCRAFSDGSPCYPCYCNAFNMSAAEIEEMRGQAGRYGGDPEGWKRALRESAAHLVREGRIRGYLAFDGSAAVGWCNANDRVNYFRVGEFDLDRVPEDAPSDCRTAGRIKSVVCFEICPGYRGRGLASRLLERVCADARAEGYEFAEGYPAEREGDLPAFTGPVRSYEKAGFGPFSRAGNTIVMRKKL